MQNHARCKKTSPKMHWTELVCGGGGRQSSHWWGATDGSLWPSSSQAYEEMGELGMERQWEAEQLQLLADKSSRVA
jgi:hypothetical protein